MSRTLSGLAPAAQGRRGPVLRRNRLNDPTRYDPTVNAELWMAEKRISLQKLARLIPDLSVDQISRLPLDRLPISLPEPWCQQFPADKREALLVLSRQLSDPEQRARAETRLHEQLNAAARWILRPESLSDWLKTVEHNLIQAESLLQHWRESSGHLRSSGTWSSPASMQSEIELASSSAIGLGDLEHVCSTLLLSFNSRQQVVHKYARLLHSMEKAIQRQYPLPSLPAAVEEAERQLQRLGQYMSRFRLLRLHLVNEDMTGLKRSIEAMSRKRLELDSNLESVRHELRLAESWSNRLGMSRKRPDPEALRQSIRDLEAERQELIVPVSDDQIYHWLNVLTDAILDEYCQSMAQTLVDRARVLFVGLLKYRRRYSSEPDVNVSDALSRSRRDDATRELQQLLQGIFSRHEPDPIKAVQAPQQFQASLEQLKNQLLQELLSQTTPRYAISS